MLLTVMCTYEEAALLISKLTSTKTDVASTLTVSHLFRLNILVTSVSGLTVSISMLELI